MWVMVLVRALARGWRRWAQRVKFDVAKIRERESEDVVDIRDEN